MFRGGGMTFTNLTCVFPICLLSGGSQGNMYQVEKTVEELNAIYQMVARYYMNFTGMNQDEVEEETCRDNFLTPGERRGWRAGGGVTNPLRGRCDRSFGSSRSSGW